jgi:EAL domain-containing protein (putative c-di-GMP-specific phosphodiesterase class I)
VAASFRCALDMNVNLSGKQVLQEDLLEQVVQALSESGLPAKHLVLEITEGVVMERPDAAIKLLERLKALGIQINIDDFGTGYSSLAQLQRFPVDTMKIDRSFISSGKGKMEIVKAIITLAHNLNLKVTAEGVETPEQMARLQSLKCEDLQGYLFSKPIIASAANELLSAGQSYHTTSKSA